MRALEHGYRLGAHGLPLMGTGDWNDGMKRSASTAKARAFGTAGFSSRAQLRLQRWPSGADRRRMRIGVANEPRHLRDALEANAWDGAWYRRAYFDDGTPLGSAENDECQIDAIPQAWAVISGVGGPGASSIGDGCGSTTVWCGWTTS